MKRKIISAEGITRTFHSRERTFTALRNVSLSVTSGEYLAIVGKSGSGKSTLLNMITGIDHPTSGTLLVNDTDISCLNESRLAVWRGANIGIVFQFFQLIPALTVKENLLLAMEFAGVIPVSLRSKRADELLDSTGIIMHANKMPASLSGGEQQRAAIARALANDPPIIVADEPTGNLDSRTAETIHSLFSSLVAAGKTVIVVTHEKDAGARYDRVVTLSDGEIVTNKAEADTLWR